MQVCRGEADVDGDDFAMKIQNFPKKLAASELLTFIHQNELKELYPNLRIALRIANTLPVSVETNEKLFKLYHVSGLPQWISHH